MNSNSSGGKLEAFFTGKGFYIVLFLCAAVIGISAWMMAAGERTMEKDLKDSEHQKLDQHRVETVILPTQPSTEPVDELYEEPVEVMAEPVEEQVPVMAEEVKPVDGAYLWPLTGEIERSHSPDVLGYDVTMRDWRNHEGMDILAPLGTTVYASHAGTVESVEQDDLMGTVVTVSHGDGTRTVYANLADTPAVKAGDQVELGAVIGAVGDTALCEVGQGTHLHFSITMDGASVDPLRYLPG